MTWGMVAVAGATVVGGALSAGAAGKAASTQAAAADRAAELQKEQFDRSVELQEPFRQAGLLGQNRLMTYLGLGGEGQYDDVAYNKALANYNSQLSAIDPSQYMSGGGGGQMVATGGDGSMEYYQEGPGGTFNQQAYDAARAGIVAPNRENFRLAGGNANDPSFGKYATAEYTPEMFAKGKDPGYEFRLSEGLKALDRQAAARGGLISGSALKASMRYGQDMGSQEYGNAFNRYQIERTNTLNPYQAMAGQGQSVANQLSQTGQNYANNAGEAYQGAANARASGYVGQANAIGSTIGNLSNMYYQNQLMNRVFPGKP